MKKYTTIIKAAVNSFGIGKTADLPHGENEIGFGEQSGNDNHHFSIWLCKYL